MRIIVIIASLFISTSILGEDLNKLIGSPKSKVNISIECSIAISSAIKNYQEYSNIPGNGFEQINREFNSILCLEKGKEITVILLPKVSTDKFIKGGDIVYSFNKYNLSLIKRRFGR